MVTLSEIQDSAMLLPEDQRAKLAESLLESLPAVLDNDDEGIAEAYRRDEELENDPSAGMSLSEFRSVFEK